MIWLGFAMDILWVLYMWNSQRFMSANDLDTVSNATRRVSTALAEAPHGQIIDTYWNTTLQQNNISSIAVEAHTTVILKEVC
jgi:hypothetical protein